MDTIPSTPDKRNTTLSLRLSNALIILTSLLMGACATVPKTITSTREEVKREVPLTKTEQPPKLTPGEYEELKHIIQEVKIYKTELLEKLKTEKNPEIKQIMENIIQTINELKINVLTLETAQDQKTLNEAIKNIQKLLMELNSLKSDLFYSE